MRADNLFRRLLNTVRSVDAPPRLVEALIAVYEEHRTALLFTPPDKTPAQEDRVVQLLAAACARHVAACEDRHAIWANTVETWSIRNLTPAPRSLSEPSPAERGRCCWWCWWCV
jgi:hypothetical protein